MDERFDTPRRLRRMAPKTAATAAVFRNAEKLAYGVIANVSTTGACIVTDRRLPPGNEVTLKLSFYRQADLYEIPARIVWSRRGGAGEKAFAGLQLHGVQFTVTSAVLKARLHELLTGDSFIDVYRPTSTEFDVLQKALSPELDQLVAKIDETTGPEK